MVNIANPIIYEVNKKYRLDHEWSGGAPKTAGREEGGWPGHLQVTSPAADNATFRVSSLPRQHRLHKYPAHSSSRAPSLRARQNTTIPPSK